MAYKPEPYKSPKTLAKEALEFLPEVEARHLHEQAIDVAINAVFKYAESVEERLNTMLEVNHIWDGS
jgi:HD-GYP domain-containing protein (c-di-GMP phosphodiesterase class II)